MDVLQALLEIRILIHLLDPRRDLALPCQMAHHHADLSVYLDSQLTCVYRAHNHKRTLTKKHPQGNESYSLGDISGQLRNHFPWQLRFKAAHILISGPRTRAYLSGRTCFTRQCSRTGHLRQRYKTKRHG